MRSVHDRPLPPTPSGHGFLRLVESALRSLTTLSFAQLCPSRFHLPIPLRSTGITPLLHYYEDSDASRLRLFAPMLGDELRLPFRVAFPTSPHSNFPPFHPQSPDTLPAMHLLDSSADCRSCLALHGSASGLGLRLWLADSPLCLAESSSTWFCLWTGCSPPAALHPVSRRRSCLQLRRSSFPSGRDFHPTVGVRLRAH
jgi:hypothetical protein